jgi:hypothetical protein
MLHLRALTNVRRHAFSVKLHVLVYTMLKDSLLNSMFEIGRGMRSARLLMDEWYKEPRTLSLFSKAGNVHVRRRVIYTPCFISSDRSRGGGAYYTIMMADCVCGCVCAGVRGWRGGLRHS